MYWIRVVEKSHDNVGTFSTENFMIEFSHYIRYMWLYYFSVVYFIYIRFYFNFHAKNTCESWTISHYRLSPSNLRAFIVNFVSPLSWWRHLLLAQRYRLRPFVYQIVFSLPFRSAILSLSLSLANIARRLINMRNKLNYLRRWIIIGWNRAWNSLSVWLCVWDYKPYFWTLPFSFCLSL